MAKIPVLTQEELTEFCKIRSKDNETLEIEFWENVYTKRGLVYEWERKQLKKFDELVSSGNLHLTLTTGTTLSSLTDEDKLSIMKIINKIEDDEDKEQIGG